VKVFLDTSVLIAAAGSSKGASNHVLCHASEKGVRLLSCHYCLAEVQKNIAKLGEGAVNRFTRDIAISVDWVDDRYTFDKPLIFSIAKDRPVLITALANRCSILLTLDRSDFQGKLGSQVYGMVIQTPGDFLALHL
jgi:predicted nucleic acid-binding protein